MSDANYQPGDVVLTVVAFTTGTGAKRRPTLVLLDTGDADIIVAPITGQSARSHFDVGLVDWQQAGLQKASTVRTHKPVTTEKSQIERKLGQLTPRDWAQVRAAVQQLWAAI